MCLASCMHALSDGPSLQRHTAVHSKTLYHGELPNSQKYLSLSQVNCFIRLSTQASQSQARQLDRQQKLKLGQHSDPNRPQCRNSSSALRLSRTHLCGMAGAGRPMDSLAALCGLICLSTSLVSAQSSMYYSVHGSGSEVVGQEMTQVGACA